MVLRQDADGRVLEYLTLLSRRRSYELVVLDLETLGEDFGWIYFYNTKEFVETGDRDSAVGDNGPIIVDRETGNIHVAGTGRSSCEHVDYYREHRTLKDMSRAR